MTALARLLGARGPATTRAQSQSFDLTLDDILGREGSEAVPVGPAMAAEKRAQVRGGVLAAIALSMLALMMSLPFVGASAITVQRADAYWDSLPSDLPAVAEPTRSVMLAADGTRIAQFFAENRVEVDLDAVPETMQQAIVAIEDARFYEHNGVDLRGIGRAFASNLLASTTGSGDGLQGGSTLTQQYVKNRLLSAAEDDQTRREVTSRTSYMRKLREAKLAIELERKWSKDQILEGYLNISYFGDGAYGVGTAARHYFNKDVSDLTLSESALLAGLVQNPSALDPTKLRSKARDRRDVVLSRMLDLGDIDARQYRQARRSPVRLDVTTEDNGCTDSRFPFYCQWVLEQFEDDPAFGTTRAQRNERLFRGGLVIKTALEPKRQEVAQAAVDEALGRENRVASAAVVVRPGTGEVVAMAVNRTFGTPDKGKFDRTEVVLPTAPAMQPGSNFKPITLAAALERGFDPASTLYAPDPYSPAGLASPPGGFSNSAAGGSGDLNAYQATARSSNTWYVRLEEEVGVLNVAAMAQRLGLTSLPLTGDGAITDRDAALTLGAYEVSPVEMAGVYATFAAHGIACVPHPIVSATGPSPDDGGRVDIDVPDPDCHQAIPASVADTVSDVLRGVVDGPDPLRTGSAQSIGRPVTGKTGTTTENAAVWFSGYTPQYATSVWVGDPRGGFAYPLQNFYAYGSLVSRAYGGIVAGPIWRQVMLGIHDGIPVEDFRPPSTTVSSGTVVPDVRGLSLDQAYRALRDAGYEVLLARGTAKRDPILTPNIVASTSPAAGTFLGLDSPVTITLTAGSDLDVRLPKQG